MVSDIVEGDTFPDEINMTDAKNEQRDGGSANSHDSNIKNLASSTAMFENVPRLNRPDTVLIYPKLFIFKG